MAPSKPPRSLKVHVPKHGCIKVSAPLAAAIKQSASASHIRFRGNGARSLALSQSKGASAENASEWNSLLVHARADRGPQWDVGTQSFHVDKGSKLYFDPTPLYGEQEEDLPDGEGHDAPPNHVDHEPGALRLQTPGRPHPHPQDHGQGHYPFMGNSPHTPNMHDASPHGLPPHMQARMGTPSQQPGMMSSYGQDRGGMTSIYGNSPAGMNGISSSSLHGHGPPGMNGIPPSMTMMNGHGPVPSPSPSRYAGNLRGYPSGGMNMFGS